MDIKTYEDQPEYKESALAAKNASQTDAANPGKMAIENDASLTTIVQSFIAIQSQTNHSLIEYISKTIAPRANDLAIGTDTLDQDGQKQFLTNIASSQNLLSCQLEKSLHQQISAHQGVHLEKDLHLINPPPSVWGTADKVSDSLLKLIFG